MDEKAWTQEDESQSEGGTGTQDLSACHLI